MLRMPNSSRSQPAAAVLWGALLVTVSVWAALLLGIGLVLRAQLRSQLLEREAQALQDLVDLRSEALLADPNQAELVAGPDAAFSVLLEASRLRGVLTARLYDGAGVLLHALPLESGVAPASGDLLGEASQVQSPQARLHEQASLAQVLLGDPSLGQESLPSAPLLEVVAPLRLLPHSEQRPFTGHFWMDGAALAHAFSRLDSGLWLQGLLVFALGSLGLSGGLLWTLRRLAQAHARVLRSELDLRRANMELSLSARTAALGAVSAHLLHDIKNPLLGLEGFLEDGEQGLPPDGTAWAEARDTTRRLRALVQKTLEFLRSRPVGRGAGTVEAPSLLVSELVAAEDFANARVCVQGLDTHLGDRELVGLGAGLAPLILHNLLDNALAASPPESCVTVVFSLDGSCLTLRVCDHGPGLPDPLREGVFGPTKSAKLHGCGLGLALSQHLATLAGGSLELLSTGPDGTTLLLRLPLATASLPGSRSASSVS